MLLWSGYGKHHRWDRPVRALFTDNAAVSDHAPAEVQDPMTWCTADYALVVSDSTGINSSEGDVTTWSLQEGDDIHDTIEWIAGQPWCTGKVGMGGASYFAIVQWFAGATRPPHLAALMPYDGMSDLYRECAFHGGIPNLGFVRFWNAQTRCSLNRAEDWVKAMAVHPFDDAYWDSKRPAVENINVPTYLIASWSDHAIHTRGSLSAFVRLGTDQKRLEVHGRNKWARMYTPESVRRQMAFFDRFLKGGSDEIDTWPRVRLEVRERIDVGQERAEDEWPLARTRYAPFHLDASDGSLNPDPFAVVSSMSCEANATEPHAVFSMMLARDTELTATSSASSGSRRPFATTWTCSPWSRSSTEPASRSTSTTSPGSGSGTPRMAGSARRGGSSMRPGAARISPCICTCATIRCRPARSSPSRSGSGRRAPCSAPAGGSASS